MKVIVFGSTGGTGNLVVQQALESGFDVTQKRIWPILDIDFS